MTLPVSGLTAAEAYAAIRARGRQARDMALQLQAQVTSGLVFSAFLLDVANMAVATVAEVGGIRSTPGLADYTRQQFGADATMDVTAQLDSTLSALASLGGAIRSEYPKDANGILADRSFQADGQVSWVTIPNGALSGTATALADFLATVT